MISTQVDAVAVPLPHECFHVVAAGDASLALCRAGALARRASTAQGPFWRDGWSVFDFVIVTVSLVSLKFDSVPGLSTLRLMRAFRVLRLFGRLSDLRQVRESERESKSEREREKERETCSLHY